MDRVEIYEFEGRKLPLVFTYAVSEYVDEKFGGFTEFAKVLKGKALSTLAADLFVFMNRQGVEYVKLKYKDSPELDGVCLEPVTREELALLLPPMAADGLLSAISRAFSTALENTIQADEVEGKNGKSA